ncbi:FAD:protein FMN transferase [Naasia aerilata]|uniref:FAD:protein FMN transferase n=1 Tax=Naasia aerilata TaxID=1162966 RepID=A0ABM8G7Z0_9MICO|nr:FAD:protein FMN transferase [Naasia aerilata]BDZ44294.1 FAD:protein FMN transferase [Naasia aerilata]
MPPSERRFSAIGAPWRIDTEEPLDDAGFERVLALVEEFDRAYSRFRDDSLVARLARDGGTVDFPEDAEPMFALYAALYRATDGALTPLVGASLEQLGYDPAYRLTPRWPALPSPAWDDRLRVEGSRVTAAEPVLLDVGAAGKGALVDLVSAELRAVGVGGATVDASGDLLHTAPEPLRVALEHPYDSSLAIGVVEVSGAICASAANRRAWADGLHHVLDGRTGLPVREVAATWVLSETALEADGLATALFLTDPERLLGDFDFRWVRMFTDGSADYSDDLPGEVFAA